MVWRIPLENCNNCNTATTSPPFACPHTDMFSLHLFCCPLLQKSRKTKKFQ